MNMTKPTKSKVNKFITNITNSDANGNCVTDKEGINLANNTLESIANHLNSYLTRFVDLDVGQVFIFQDVSLFDLDVITQVDKRLVIVDASISTYHKFHEQVFNLVVNNECFIQSGDELLMPVVPVIKLSQVPLLTPFRTLTNLTNTYEVTNRVVFDSKVKIQQDYFEVINKKTGIEYTMDVNTQVIL